MGPNFGHPICSKDPRRHHDPNDPQQDPGWDPADYQALAYNVAVTEVSDGDKIDVTDLITPAQAAKTIKRDEHDY